MARRSIGQLFDATDDTWLCEEVADRISKQHGGNELDVDGLTVHERVVRVIVQSSAAITNGGFQYLFEGNFKGDPGFVLTAAAYRTIGASRAAEAFAEALALFPENRVPSDVESRLDLYQAVPKDDRDRIDAKYWDAYSNDKIWKKLAAYIRANRSEFQHLPG